MEIKGRIAIPLDTLKPGLVLDIFPEGDNFLRELPLPEAEEMGEAAVQLLEGKSYEYLFSCPDYRLRTNYNGIITQSRSTNLAGGRIVPNIYVGTLTAYASHKDNPEKEFTVSFEVLASKFDNEPNKSYREHYRYMLESITDKCTELLMQINSPVHQNYEVDFDQDPKTIYQRFCFVRSIINSPEFEEAIQKIISNPKTNWSENPEVKDTRNIRRFNQSSIRQLVSGSNRTALDEGHLLRRYGLNSIPSKIQGVKKVEILDNPENRFIKHALEVYLSFCENCLDKFSPTTRERKEADILVKTLENILSHNFFKEISRPTTLRLNSTVLQRKSGYREILSSWLKFDLAAKLIWKGGDDVYQAGKRDIAALYEYWLFFTLYDLFKGKFKLDQHSGDDISYNHLFEFDKDKIQVIVKRGKHVALKGKCDFGTRVLMIKFSFNRSFQGGNMYTEGNSGSWTSTLRPDYTLTFWPADMKEKDAEKLEQIVHIHFDAKYKVNQFLVNIGSGTEDLDLEKEEERKGNYKNADLLKMHAYKDAIRRTGGAYILYPGTEQKAFRGFHEIIPGLGAFAINPSEDKSGIDKLSDFIDQVMKHLLDRISQRDRLSSKVYEIHKNSKTDDNILHEPFPEYHKESSSERIIPDETFVLVGYSRSPKRMKWYENKGLYNFRMDDDAGSLVLSKEVADAKYLLLREKGKDKADRLFQITSEGPIVYSKSKLHELGYPQIGTGKAYYLIIKIKKVKPSDFGAVKWRFKDLHAYQKSIESERNIRTRVGIPFTVTLSELMRVVERQG
ncbi:DUF2357 domain-containing protein [Cognataquiflexum rubidum]|uniref:DUF2357 domain-containing protein n=1 Tax=Cognataquiflexum rubidum TaxID=2922273 RepID=UPI001F12E05B|nr:DUF2357 domain-containing protein [Cognataquiflexum rubidum]MCH6236809.1 DUF2357 domain-containing protein [Cognataquiflexum rubidum]